MKDSLTENIAALKDFWARWTFHDMAVESIERRNARIIVLLDHYVLILNGVKRYTQDIEEFPTSWISCVIVEEPRYSKRNVSLELGGFECEYAKLRLMRCLDYVMLIPPIDQCY